METGGFFGRANYVPVEGLQEKQIVEKIRNLEMPKVVNIFDCRKGGIPR